MDWPTTCTVQLLLPLLQHFPESLFTAFFLFLELVQLPNLSAELFFWLKLLNLAHFLVQPPQSFSRIIIFFITGRFVQRLKLLNLAHLYGLAKYMHSTVLLLSPQHFPESSFTALFLISWIGPTSTIFQHDYYFFYYQIRLLLLLLQHFPESSFTALFFISWIGPTSTIFQQNYYLFITGSFVQRLISEVT